MYVCLCVCISHSMNKYFPYFREAFFFLFIKNKIRCATCRYTVQIHSLLLC
jgi:hypothetical protein